MGSTSSFKVVMVSLANKTVQISEAREMDRNDLLIQQNARVSLLLHLGDRDMTDLKQGKQVTLDDILLRLA